jgi:hypothetical protein
MAADPTIGPQPISTARPESSFVIAIGLNCTTLQFDLTRNALKKNSVQSWHRGLVFSAHLITLSALANTFGETLTICDPSAVLRACPEFIEGTGFRLAIIG